MSTPTEVKTTAAGMSTIARRTLVYVSGPLTTGMLTANVRRACEAGAALLRHGYAAIVPHTNVLWECIEPLTYDDWLRHDLELIRHVDVVLRLPGDSHGADVETEWAAVLGKPVYSSLEALLAADDPRRDAVTGHPLWWPNPATQEIAL